MGFILFQWLQLYKQFGAIFTWLELPNLEKMPEIGIGIFFG